MNYEVIPTDFIVYNGFSYGVRVLNITKSSDRYNITATEYVNKELTYTNTVIYKNMKPCMSFYSDRHCPEYLYVNQNGKDFIISSGNHRCITIVNLTDETIESYTNKDLYDNGFTFTPCIFNWDEHTESLIVSGLTTFGECVTYTFENIDLKNPKFNWKQKIELSDSNIIEKIQKSWTRKYS